MWFAYGFPITWWVLLGSGITCMSLGAHKQWRGLISVGAWLFIAAGVLMLIGFIPILAGFH